LRHIFGDGPPVGPQVIFGMDRDGRCTLSVGPGLGRLGLQPGELVGQNLLDLYSQDEGALEALQRALAGERFSLEREWQGRRLSVYYEPMFDAGGNVTGTYGVSTDVTEQRAIEEEVRCARERATLLAELAGALSREGRHPDKLLRVAVELVTNAVADVGVIWLCTADGTALEAKAVRRSDEGVTGRPDDGPRHAPGGPFRLDVAAANELSGPQLHRLDGTGTAAQDPCLTDWSGSLAPSSMLRAPLRSRGALVGLIDLARAAERSPFSQSDLDLVRDLSDRCALALDNALLLEAHSEASEQLVKFQALADASDDLIGISEPLGEIVYVNPAVHEFGTALAAGDVWATIATYVRRSEVAAIRDCLTTTGRWSGDLTVTAGEESRVGHLDVFELAHPDTGAGLGAAWIGRDVTELRATEAALRATNADMMQFMALVEASPDFIAIAGLDGQVRYVNPNGRRLVGLPPDRDVTTTTIPDYLTPEGLEASMKVEQPAVLANGHWEGESTLRGPGGVPIPVAIASFLVRDPQTGEPFALATVQRDISDRIASEQALRDLAEQRQALLSRLVDAQDAERSQIAADVHDDPVQALAAVDLRLGLLRRKLRESAPDLLDTLEPLQASVSGATDRLRALLFDLEPPDLQHGLAAALGRAAEEMFEHTDTHWAVEAGADPELPDATRAIAYRVGKEAMNNVRKHAHADQVTITVNGVRGGVELTVTDDGVGLPTDPLQSLPGHRGILNMQDRAAVAGGSCTVVRGAHGGTEVRAWLPGQGTPAA